MRIQHNIMAMNAYRNLGINNKGLTKNLEKLSSGYRINRAGDDAAGLAISEKMRSQIAGLDQAQKNAQSGINLIQTAEGALTEVHDMLNRMVTLSTQAANGTYSKNDLDKIQDEVNALVEEIDRIAENSNFNGTKLLDGSLGTGAVDDAGDGDAAETVKTVTATLDATNAAKLTGDTAFAFDAAVTDEVKTAFLEALGENGAEISVTVTDKDSDAATLAATDEVTISGIPAGYTAKYTDATGAEATVADGTALEVGVATGDIKAENLALTLEDGQGNKVGTLTIGLDAADTADGTSKITLAVEETEAGDGAKGARAADAAEEVTGGFQLADGANLASFGIEEINFGDLTVDEEVDVKVEYVADDTDGTLKVTVGDTVYAYKADDTAATLAGTEVTLADTTDPTNTIKVTLATGQSVVGNDKVTQATDGVAEATVGTFAPAPAEEELEEEEAPAGPGLQLQIGSSAQETIMVNIDDMGAVALGIATEGDDGKAVAIDITDPTKANKAIDTINAAIEQVSTQRGKLGALQNRLEHTINNLGVMEENIQDAEANIRDTDIADEMMAYTKNNILIQSAQAMLAQANQAPQGVLQLMG